MTYPERSAEAAQMAVDLTNGVDDASRWHIRDVEFVPVVNAFAGYIDETLAFRKRVDEVARYVCKVTDLLPHANEQLRSIMLPDPVDPDVLLARDVAGKVLRAEGFPGTAERAAAGIDTKNAVYRGALAGIKAAREADNAHT